MDVGKKRVLAASENSALSWILAAVLAFSIGVPLVAGAVLRFIF